MKIRNLMLVLATATLVLSGCSGKMSPRAYNEKIVDMKNTIDRMGSVIDNLGGNISGDAAKKVVDSLATAFDNCNKELAAIKYPDKAEAFQNAVVALFKFSGDSIVPAMKVVANTDKNSDAYNAAVDKLNNLTQQGSKLEDVLIDEQAKYAQVSGYGLE